MKILGIDTSTKFLSLGAYDNGRVCEYNMDLGRLHSSLMVVIIKRVVGALGWKFGDIDYFACGLGPGSFTGIRVGVAAIKGLSWSLNKPIAGIPTLDILARNVKETGSYIVPAIDAKRNFIYCSIYKTKNNILKRVSPYMLLTQYGFFKKVKPASIILGDAVSIYKENMLKDIKGVNILDNDYWYPKGRKIIELALEKIKNKKLDTSFSLKPIYLYPKECQIKKTSV